MGAHDLLHNLPPDPMPQGRHTARGPTYRACGGALMLTTGHVTERTRGTFSCSRDTAANDTVAFVHLWIAARDRDLAVLAARRLLSAWRDFPELFGGRDH